MNKEDLYNTAISINENNFDKIQNILLILGFNWQASGNNIIDKEDYNYIKILKNKHNIYYKEDVIFFSNNIENYKIINGDNFIRKFKIKKLND